MQSNKSIYKKSQTIEEEVPTYNNLNDRIGIVEIKKSVNKENIEPQQRPLSSNPRIRSSPLQNKNIIPTKPSTPNEVTENITNLLNNRDKEYRPKINIGNVNININVIKDTNNNNYYNPYNKQIKSNYSNVANK